MSQTDHAPGAPSPGDAADASAEDGAHHDDHHPTPRQYVQVAVVLAVLTALEVSLFYVDVGAAALPTLIVLMTVKFGLVVAWFMHLKFDSRTFTRLMLTGLTLAGGIYTIVLLTFLDVAR